VAHYTKTLTVPANTPSATPTSTTIDLPAGVLERVDITFPPGCARMTHVQIWDGATLMYPKETGTDFAEDAYTVSIGDMVIWDAVKTLTLKGWSPLTNYQHNITFHFYVRTSEEIAMSRTGYY